MSATIADDRVLTITRTFDAPRETVWAAWIDFNHARHFDGPAGHPMKSMRSDLRVGGTWRNVMRYDGKDMPQSGVYREVKAPEVLSFTFAPGKRATASAGRKRWSPSPSKTSRRTRRG